MKILLFGGDGQLGFELTKRIHDLNFELIAPVISEIDITDREQVLYLSEKTSPDVIINCAAYTAVDKAEEEIDLAFAVNRDGAANLAAAAKEYGSRLVHISTDYVFDGTGSSALDESAPTNPQGVYGRSKLEGEQAILDIMPERSTILRTAWLHGRRGPNFLQTMIRLFRERDELQIVDDQIGSPTWAGWLADVILDICRLSDVHGVFHATCLGETSWYGFAEAIYEEVKESLEEEGHSVRLLPQSTEQSKRPAPRPAYSVLDCGKLAGLLGRKPLSWQQGMVNHLIELGLKE